MRRNMRRLSDLTDREAPDRSIDRVQLPASGPDAQNVRNPVLNFIDGVTSGKHWEQHCACRAPGVPMNAGAASRSLIAIVGPTAAGKSELAMFLAENLN